LLSQDLNKKSTSEESKHSSVPVEGVQSKKKEKSFWDNPLKNLVVKPVGKVIMFPVKVVGTVAHGVQHGI
jgi:hypothetical protein